jgi:hypothetical protein
LVENTFRANVEQAVQLVGKPGVTLTDNHFTDNRSDVMESGV